jgi:hypothetical protein
VHAFSLWHYFPRTRKAVKQVARTRLMLVEMAILVRRCAAELCVFVVGHRAATHTHTYMHTAVLDERWPAGRQHAETEKLGPARVSVAA